ncbi:MAG: AbrB/MazE/SpoVT family DNA-binding domain-containing protein [Candidatus Bathyarchaeia archaeon]
MKLQKQLSRKVAGKEYPKYVVTIPPDCVDKLGWKQGVELDMKIKEDKLVIQPKNIESNTTEA